MSVVIKNIIRIFILLFFQVFIVTRIPPLHQFIVPYFYFVLILWLPFKISRINLMVVGFLIGSAVDWFFKTPGLHAAASLLIAYLRPFVINLLLPKEATEWGVEEPSNKTMGSVSYSVYIIILTILHHAYLIFLEWLQFGSFLYFIAKLFATGLVSLLLILIADLFFNKKSTLR
ncbi:MAG: rod shape-determining protein MreD [Chitinophagaceae bacterium]|jgi:hypothetical protein